MDVHTGGQKHIHAIFQDFVTHGPGHTLHQVDIPGAGQKGTHRETGAVIGVAVTLAGGLDAQAGRAVGEDGAGDAEALDRAGVAGGAGNLPGGTGGDAVHHGGTGAAHQQGGFLLQSHRLDDFFDVVLGQLRLGKRTERHAKRRKGQKDLFHKSVLGLISFSTTKVGLFFPSHLHACPNVCQSVKVFLPPRTYCCLPFHIKRPSTSFGRVTSTCSFRPFTW